MYYQNVRGFRTKLHIHINIQILLYSHTTSLLTETGPTEDFTNAELGLNGYNIFRFD